MTTPTDRLSTALAERYRIERHLGEGGMATVYLAEDLRHKRKVALKVLRPELAAVLGAERFVQEITTTASLQHPHILGLFDSGQADGFLYYVMPYIQGETLREKLSRETQLGIDEALRITSEVADALDYAHRTGVIHRDIKPENILLHDGRAIVADFGIALAVSAAAGGRMTETGLSLGTPHYMSPEQATAEKHVTNRSDVYSLGCVLYEMLTGEPPHTGASAQAIIMKIVTDEARPITQLRKSVPPHVAAAVAQALEKLPADRFESARAFAEALRNPSFTSASAVPGTTASARLAGPPARQPVGVALAAASLLLAALAAWGWLRSPPALPVSRQPTTLWPDGAMSGTDLVTQVAIAPNGAFQVFRMGPAGSAQLYVKRRDELTPQPLAGTTGGSGPFFSPDGEWIAFYADGQLRKMPSTGGGSLKLADSVSAFIGQGAWLDDGTIVFADFPELRRVPAAGGPSEVLVRQQDLGDRVPWLPKGLPGTQGFLFSACTPPSCGRSSVHVYDARRDTVRLLFEDALGIWYAPPNHVLYLTRTGTLLFAPWDNDALRPTGPGVPVLDGIQAPGFVFSAGTALYVLGPPLFNAGPIPNAELVWVDRSGRVELVDPAWRFNTGGGNWGLALSPDGRRLAIRLLTDLGPDVWIKQLPAGPLSRLTFYEGEDRAPMWTPDGRGVTFISNRPPPGDTASGGNAYNLWMRPADGTGEPSLLWPGHNPSEGFVSPDDQWLILRTSGPAGGLGGRDILAVRRGTDTVARRLLAAPHDELGPMLSPDSRWIAYVSNETGTNEVFVRPFPNVESGKWQVSTNGGTAPVWAHNGRELLYLGGGNMNVVEIRPGPPFTVGEPRVLFASPERVRSGSAFGHYFDITPDDQRFIMVRNVQSADSTDAPTLVLVQNFFEELKGKAGR